MIIREVDRGVELAVRAAPRANKTEIAGPYGDRAVKIRLAAPPVDGAANDELVAFLTELFDLPRSAVEIVRGHGGRQKVVRVVGVSAETARERLGL